MAEIATSHRFRASVIADRLAVNDDAAHDASSRTIPVKDSLRGILLVPARGASSRGATSGLRQRMRSADEHPMLYTVAMVLFVLWLLGISVFHVAGGVIHLLLVMAIGAFVWHFVSGRKLA